MAMVSAAESSNLTCLLVSYRPLVHKQLIYKRRGISGRVGGGFGMDSSRLLFAGEEREAGGRRRELDAGLVDGVLDDVAELAIGLAGVTAHAPCCIAAEFVVVSASAMR